MTPLKRTPYFKPPKVHFGKDDDLRRADYGFIFSDDIERWCTSKYRQAKVKSHNKQRERTFKKENVI